MFIDKRISLALIWYIILPHNRHLTLHNVANVKLVYMRQFNRIHRTENRRNETLLFAFPHQRSSMCPSNASLDDETDKNHLVLEMGSMERVQATRTPDTRLLPMSVIAFCLYQHSGLRFAFFSIIRAIDHLLWPETYQIKAYEILFLTNIFQYLYVAYRVCCRQGGITWCTAFVCY